MSEPTTPRSTSTATSPTAASGAPTAAPRRRVPGWLPILALIAALFVLALYLGRPTGDAEGFGGTDAAATEQIEADHPGYRPWFEPLYAPSGGEVESGLFALQAALGAGGLGFVLGALWQRSRGRTTADAARPTAPADTPASQPTGGDAPR